MEIGASMEDRLKNNGAGKNRMTEPVKSADKPVPPKTRTPATQADFLAAQLHEARTKLASARAELLDKAKLLLQKDQLLLQREQRILQLESAIVDEEYKKLRDTHGLALGRTIHRDDATGEVYWFGDAPANEQDE